MILKYEGSLTLPYNVMIGGLASADKLGEAMALLDEGTKRGFKWDDRTFSVLLTACGWTGIRWRFITSEASSFVVLCWTCTRAAASWRRRRLFSLR